MNDIPWLLPVVKESEKGQRLDVFLTKQVLRVGHHPAYSFLPVPSRRQVQQLIANGCVFMMKEGQKHSLENVAYRIKKGISITITFPAMKKPSLLHTSAKRLSSLEIFYEDNNLLVLNKNAGIVIHKGAGYQDYTLVDVLLNHCGSFLSPGMGEQRPGIIHRLDKNTSGLLLIAKHQGIHESLARQFRPSSPTHKKQARRLYHALVWHPPAKDAGVITAPIVRHPIKRIMMTIAPHGRVAITHYRIVKRWQWGKTTMGLIACRLETGRTHQIRVHLRSLESPIVGDSIYGWREEQKTLLQWEQSRDPFPYSLKGQMLHASGLSFYHPVMRMEMAFFAPLPMIMRQLIRWCNRANLKTNSLNER